MAMYDEFEDFELDEGGMGFVPVILAAIAVLAILAIVMKKRRKGPESSLDKVMDTIRHSDMPERTRKTVISALDDTREGITSLRESAEKIAKRAS